MVNVTSRPPTATSLNSQPKSRPATQTDAAPTLDAWASTMDTRSAGAIPTTTWLPASMIPDLSSAMPSSVGPSTSVWS